MRGRTLVKLATGFRPHGAEVMRHPALCVDPLIASGRSQMRDVARLLQWHGAVD
jgi:hypothetical protein